METSAFKADAKGNVTSLSSADNSVSVTGAKVLTIADSGITQVLKAATGAAITLPAVTAGKWKLRFEVGLAFATSGWVITLPSAVLQGGAIVNSVFVPCASKSVITFAAASETLGDYIELSCDGSQVTVSGIGAAASSIAFT